MGDHGEGKGKKQDKVVKQWECDDTLRCCTPSPGEILTCIRNLWPTCSCYDNMSLNVMERRLQAKHLWTFTLTRHSSFIKGHKELYFTSCVAIKVLTRWAFVVKEGQVLPDTQYQVSVEQCSLNTVHCSLKTCSITHLDICYSLPSVTLQHGLVSQFVFKKSDYSLIVGTVDNLVLNSISAG